LPRPALPSLIRIARDHADRAMPVCKQKNSAADFLAS
jgi:hypothetical protein